MPEFRFVVEMHSPEMFIGTTNIYTKAIRETITA